MRKTLLHHPDEPKKFPRLEWLSPGEMEPGHLRDWMFTTWRRPRPSSRRPWERLPYFVRICGLVWTR